MSVISANNFDAERKSFNNIIYKINSIVLHMLIIYLKRSNSCGIINSGVLELFNSFAVFVVKEKEFNIYLYMVTMNLFSQRFKDLLLHFPMIFGSYLTNAAAGLREHRFVIL
ncbi:MAG: hypothetical protein LBD84_05700 [Campylobacteraceae bacterium]|nr:hypothetical protein [Campylobacteraceae bacterium]